MSQETVWQFDREKHEDVRDQYTKLAVKYAMFTNLISVLPLLGLLGTIGGLMPGLRAVKAQDFDTLYSSLSTALTSTFLGLIATIGLKAFAYIFPDKKVNEIEIQFEEIDRKYDIGVDYLSRKTDNVETE